MSSLSSESDDPQLENPVKIRKNCATGTFYVVAIIDIDDPEGAKPVAFAVRSTPTLVISTLKNNKLFDELIKGEEYKNKLASLMALPMSKHENKVEAQCALAELTIKHRPKYNFKRMMSYHKMGALSKKFAAMGMGGHMGHVKKLAVKLGEISESDSD